MALFSNQSSLCLHLQNCSRGNCTFHLTGSNRRDREAEKNEDEGRKKKVSKWKEESRTRKTSEMEYKGEEEKKSAREKKMKGKGKKNGRGGGRGGGGGRRGGVGGRRSGGLIAEKCGSIGRRMPFVWIIYWRYINVGLMWPAGRPAQPFRVICSNVWGDQL